MKVKDLISKLENADPEQEVFATPLIFMPIVQLNDNDGTLSDEGVKKVVAPFEGYPIERVGLMTDWREGVAKSKQYVFIGYDPDEQSSESSGNLTTLEFVN